eukprot:scaffold69579_cov70-Phaeocystis_antarctica.AAC.2
MTPTPTPKPKPEPRPGPKSKPDTGPNQARRQWPTRARSSLSCSRCRPTRRRRASSGATRSYWARLTASSSS